MSDITIEGRAYLYNFNFQKFRDRAEEALRPVNVFHCQGIFWKFRFGGELRLYLNGNLLWAAIATDSDMGAYPLLTPYKFTSDDNVCIEVRDISKRWFRWFRRNSGSVTLEGIEEDPTT